MQKKLDVLSKFYSILLEIMKRFNSEYKKLRKNS